ncbi:hypothetical protein P3W45_001589 [Vairimorpha bombi]
MTVKQEEKIFLTLEGSDRKEIVNILTEKESSGDESPKENENELLDKSFFFGLNKKNKVKYPEARDEDKEEESNAEDTWKKVGARGEFGDVVIKSDGDDDNKGKESGDIKTNISKDFPSTKNDGDKSNLEIEEINAVRQDPNSNEKETQLDQADLLKIINENEDIKKKYEESKPIGRKISDAVKNNEFISGKNKTGTFNKLKVISLHGLENSNLHKNLDLDTLLTHTKKKKKNV